MTDGKYDNKPEDTFLLVQASFLAEVVDTDPEGALRQALGFLTGKG